MRRISVIGCSGSGKSTLSAQLSELLGAPHIELDSLFHQPGWTETPRDEFRAALSARMARDAWIVDGNYESRARDLVWGAADTVVWLDLPLTVVMRQVIRRTFGRLRRREVLWNGNRERWWNLIHPWPANNIILWSFTNYPRVRKRSTKAMSDPKCERLVFVRLRSRHEVDAFLDQVRQSRG